MTVFTMDSTLKLDKFKLLNKFFCRIFCVWIDRLYRFWTTAFLTILYLDSLNATILYNKYDGLLRKFVMYRAELKYDVLGRDSTPVISHPGGPAGKDDTKTPPT